jgi:flagellar FliL protein
MAEKEEKKSPAKKEVVDLDPNEKIAKKRKLILFAGMGGVLLLSLGIGSFFILKIFTGQKHAEQIAQTSSAHSDSGKEKLEAEKNKKSETKKDTNSKADAPKDGAKKDNSKKDDGSKNDSSKKEEVKGTANFGDTFSVSRMDLNLGNPLENRFIRISVTLEYRGGENQGAELKKREPQIKDIIINSVTTKTRISLTSELGKENLRREILNKINEVTDRPIQNVFFTEFFVE